MNLNKNRVINSCCAYKPNRKRKYPSNMGICFTGGYFLLRLDLDRYYTISAIQLSCPVKPISSGQIFKLKYSKSSSPF